MGYFAGIDLQGRRTVFDTSTRPCQGEREVGIFDKFVRRISSYNFRNADAYGDLYFFFVEQDDILFNNPCGVNQSVLVAFYRRCQQFRKLLTLYQIGFLPVFYFVIEKPLE